MQEPARRSEAAPGAQDFLKSWWMPFTANRYFRAHVKLVESASGAYYRLRDGREVFDTISGLWCTPLGHGHPKIIGAVQRQVEKLDFAAPFHIGHEPAFDLARRIASLADQPDASVFFVNSGSEAVDTALKIAVAYHRLRGDASRVRIIGRERAYHGVGLGGMSVGGIPQNRKMFAPLMIPGVDHLPHTYSADHVSFSRGEPGWGTHLANDLERIIALHDASTIAAVILEPVQGSTGVIVPPRGYLQVIREICSRHGILLIFDEVITGFGRLGTPFASRYFQVQPDLTVFAKAVTNGVVPMGGVVVPGHIYDTFMTGPAHAVEFFHGNTYSGHPLAVAAAHASLDVLIGDAVLHRSAALSEILESAVHSLRGEPHVIDIRNIGLAAAVELEPHPGRTGVRGLEVFERALSEGLLLRVTGDTIALAPPFISDAEEIERMCDSLRRTLQATS